MKPLSVPHFRALSLLYPSLKKALKSAKNVGVWLVLPVINEADKLFCIKCAVKKMVVVWL